VRVVEQADPAHATRPADAPATASPPAPKPASRAPAAAEAHWGDDFAVAVVAAKTAGKPVLIDCTGSDWCG
jgi:hypothetical protein